MSVCLTGSQPLVGKPPVAAMPSMPLAPMRKSPKDFALPKRPAFVNKMMEANQTQICVAKGAAVRKVSVEFLLHQRLRIPIFQRRYSWGEEQWRTLLGDVQQVVTGAKEKHALGRLTCVIDESGDGRAVVIDGQQRNTTSVLLLAAVRDIASRRTGDGSCIQLATTLDGLLFPGSGLDAWIEESRGPGSDSCNVAEGEALDFAALVPTYCDRAPFFAAILPPRADVSGNTIAGQRPLEAKAYFVRELQEKSNDHLRALVDAVLHKLEWLFFPLDVSREDGTQNMHVIFERLALRDATFCKPTRGSEYANMGAADFVRNLLLGSFTKEEDAVAMYKTHWLPIERAAAASAEQRCDSNVGNLLDGMLDRFVREQPESVEPGKNTAGPIGGRLYPRFRRWLTAALRKRESGAQGCADGAVEEGLVSEADMEARTAELLQRLKAFALEYFAPPTHSASLRF